jgi:PAS domain S-box-containing protein
MTGKPNSRSSAVVGDNMESDQRYLREREHQLRVLTDHLPGHVAYVGANDLCYRFVNQKFETSFGRSRKEIIGKHIKEIIGESNYEYALKYIAEVRAGKSTSYVNVFNLAQGRRWAQVNYAPDFDEQGKVLFLFTELSGRS